MDVAPRPQHRSGHRRRRSSAVRGSGHGPEGGHLRHGPDGVHLAEPNKLDGLVVDVHTDVMTNLQRKRNRHLKTSLYEEVERLKLRNTELEDRLAAAELTSYSLEGQLRQAHHRCGELEMLAQQGIVSGGIATALSANDNLRKQLSAYVVEINALHEERQGLQQSLAAAQRFTQDCKADRDKHLSSSGRAVVELQQSSSTAQQQASNFSAQVVEKDQRIAELIDTIEPLNDKLIELQTAYVHQTRQFGTFVAEVRKRLQDVDLNVEEGRREIAQHQRAASGLYMHLTDASEFHAKSIELSRKVVLEKERTLSVLESSPPSSPAKSLKRRRLPTSSVLSRALQRNIAKEMVYAMEGIILDKVQERTNTREPRMVVLSEVDNVLQWSKPHGSRSSRRTESSLDLYEVIRIEFGSMSRASVIFNDVHPWHCFSLYTVRHSYDFICPDDMAVRTFILSISRCCGWAGGAVRTRAEFECQKAWCKIHETCSRLRKTPIRALLDALRITAGHLRPMDGTLEAERRGSPVEVASSRTVSQGAFEAWPSAL